MIQITPHMRILLAVQPVDFRKGIDGLVGLCRQRLQHEPFQGALFVFINRSGKALKLLVYDTQGFWLCQKRLSRGRFAWWPAPAQAPTQTLGPDQLQLLLWNGDPSRIHPAPVWRPIAACG